MTPYAFDLNLGLAEFEAAIAGEPVEVAAAFDAEGRFVLRSRLGRSSEVHFAREEFPLLVGSVVTHNHPSGGPFSPDDAWFASEYDVLELRIVTPTGLVYWIRRPTAGWPEPAEMSEAVEGVVLMFRKETQSRRSMGETILKGNALDAWLYERQRETLARIGVEVRRGNRWA